MNKEEITRQKELAKLISIWIEFYKEPTVKLIRFLYKERYTQEDIAKALGTTKQAVSLQYPRWRILPRRENEKKSK